jgi:hypothetical protein
MKIFKLLPVPAEDYDALGITANSALESYVTDCGALVIRVLTADDMEEFACDGDCQACPVLDIGCDSECLSCPCYASCENSDYIAEECNNA